MGSIDKACISGFLCRLCSEMHRTVIHIYGEQGKKHGLVQKINGYLPISVSPNDPLPKTICETCLRRVEEHYELLSRLEQYRETILVKRASGLSTLRPRVLRLRSASTGRLSSSSTRRLPSASTSRYPSASTGRLPPASRAASTSTSTITTTTRVTNDDNDNNLNSSNGSIAATSSERQRTPTVLFGVPLPSTSSSTPLEPENPVVNTRIRSSELVRSRRLRTYLRSSPSNEILTRPLQSYRLHRTLNSLGVRDEDSDDEDLRDFLPTEPYIAPHYRDNTNEPEEEDERHRISIQFINRIVSNEEPNFGGLENEEANFEGSESEEPENHWHEDDDDDDDDDDGDDDNDNEDNVEGENKSGESGRNEEENNIENNENN